MLSENSANYSCDKVLFVPKNSNLNYPLNETPYSAYITIRKKFVKDPIKNDEPVNNTTVIRGKEEDLRTLTERNNDLEKRLALATVEYEEMELQQVQYLKDISKLEDNIENFIKTENKLIKENEELKSNKDDLKTDIEELEEKNKNLDSEKDELTERVDELCRELQQNLCT